MITADDRAFDAFNPSAWVSQKPFWEQENSILHETFLFQQNHFAFFNHEKSNFSHRMLFPLQGVM